MNHLHLFDALVIALITRGAGYAFNEFFDFYSKHPDANTWMLKTIKSKIIQSLCKPTFACYLCMNSIWGFSFLLLYGEGSYWNLYDVVPVILIAVTFSKIITSIVNKLNN